MNSKMDEDARRQEIYRGAVFVNSPSPVALVLCVVGMRTRNVRFHLIIAVIQLAYQLSWLGRALIYNQ